MRLPEFSGGTLTALKWLAVVLMIADHVDWLLLDSALGIHDTIGRLVFPIFGWILAYNLARPGAWQRGVHVRLINRLSLVGLVAMPAYVYLAGWLPLNVMFSLAAFVVVAALFELRRPGLALVGFLLLGLLVDYSWPGLAYCLAVWGAYRTRQLWCLVAAGFALASLEWVNGSQAALWAVPVLWLASFLQVRLPRHQLAFYAVYPLHLVLLAAVAYVGQHAVDFGEQHATHATFVFEHRFPPFDSFSLGSYAGGGNTSCFPVRLLPGLLLADFSRGANGCVAGGSLGVALFPCGVSPA